jgi:hypothetical protein
MRIPEYGERRRFGSSIRQGTEFRSEMFDVFAKSPELSS